MYKGMGTGQLCTPPVLPPSTHHIHPPTVHQVLLIPRLIVPTTDVTGSQLRLPYVEA